LGEEFLYATGELNLPDRQANLLVASDRVNCCIRKSAASNCMWKSRVDCIFR
jgi:hypothetical protein